ncbi:hypothetical protein PCH_Pc18g04460 [Penicillium rubens Wisconsin 54-1255]|uniref:Uncharacterized protein n=1 Tax=Penicillium rubens (strain ATCC 28089 / DSM 1075 / NRRL 1951 / Wisconsin 54-1255) TaxID=500485 RepID=B6HBL3_PENRW|nr:hypothetical protein PCH_Pc18g04460 [Penicillium rubens Wisconsin 54-1255]
MGLRTPAEDIIEQARCLDLARIEYKIMTARPIYFIQCEESRSSSMAACDFGSKYARAAEMITGQPQMYSILRTCIICNLSAKSNGLGASSRDNIGRLNLKQIFIIVSTEMARTFDGQPAVCTRTEPDIKMRGLMSFDMDAFVPNRDYELLRCLNNVRYVALNIRSGYWSYVKGTRSSLIVRSYFGSMD